MISKEYLQDSNQYQCRVCHSKQDAIRYIRLDELPTILTIQLMRFVFDMSSLCKKKLKTLNAFPTVLDMRPFMPHCFNDSNSNVNSNVNVNPEDYIYELRNAILHRGANADSGHYTCRIFKQE